MSELGALVLAAVQFDNDFSIKTHEIGNIKPKISTSSSKIVTATAASRPSPGKMLKPMTTITAWISGDADRCLDINLLLGMGPKIPRGLAGCRGGGKRFGD
ncbi:MAG: hypothetical protein CTY19_11675 [Methylomonas sp.]|nr:MAG: hypothetical protein CTY19_11675 [Methylomonas sp.]